MNEITNKEGYKVWVLREVLFRDLDAMRHMNNVASIYYFEDARVEYFKKLMALGGSEENFNSILVRVECDYIDQAHMGETLVVAVKIANVGKKSFTFEYLISELETSRIVSRGRSVSACYNYIDSKTCAISEELVALFERLEERTIEIRR